MHLDPYLVLGSVVVGFLVGLTGAGGGALMTPMLILLFKVAPGSAISSDLVATVAMRPFGAAVHLRRGTVNLALVGWCVLGSAPAALLGSYLLHLLARSPGAGRRIETALGVVLLAGAAAMVARGLVDRQAGRTAGAPEAASVTAVTVRPVPTLLVGVLGGLLVGLTSVGSGSLMVVLLLLVYPGLRARQLVGTDLTQAVPLTLAAALGALLFGQVQLAVTASLVVGSVPAVVAGSLLSSRAPDAYLRPLLTFVVFATGLKYVGVPTVALGWTLVSTLLGALAVLGYLGRRDGEPVTPLPPSVQPAVERPVGQQPGSGPSPSPGPGSAPSQRSGPVGRRAGGRRGGRGTV